MTMTTGSGWGWRYLAVPEKRLSYPKECIMEKYVCGVCGYEYDPAEHDNVPFDQLPDDWTCPVCGVGKDQFSAA